MHLYIDSFIYIYISTYRITWSHKLAHSARTLSHRAMSTARRPASLALRWTHSFAICSEKWWLDTACPIAFRCPGQAPVFPLCCKSIDVVADHVSSQKKWNRYGSVGSFTPFPTGRAAGHRGRRPEFCRHIVPRWEPLLHVHIYTYIHIYIYVSVCIFSLPLSLSCFSVSLYDLFIIIIYLFSFPLLFYFFFLQPMLLF